MDLRRFIEIGLKENFVQVSGFLKSSKFKKKLRSLRLNMEV